VWLGACARTVDGVDATGVAREDGKGVRTGDLTPRWHLGLLLVTVSRGDHRAEVLRTHLTDLVVRMCGQWCVCARQDMESALSSRRGRGYHDRNC
jgi:hypothetical protein